jgi:hypothetical protein
MDNFKISLFESEYKSRFPEHKTLSVVECRSVLQNIVERYNLSSSDVENELVSRQHFYDKVNAMEDFNLLDVLSDLGIKALADSYINWLRFEKIDKIATNDLDKYFNDIWFPSSDDIDLFDDTFSWILSIRHDGCVSVIKAK